MKGRRGTPRPRPRRVPVERVGVSLEPELLEALDRWTSSRNSPSRSDSIRSLIRKELAEKELSDPGSDAVGVVMVLYRHDASGVMHRLVAAEHRWGGHIRSTSHVHLRGGACLEVLVVAGLRGELERLSEDLCGVRGVLQGRFSLTTPSIASGSTGHRHPHSLAGPRARTRVERVGDDRAAAT